MAPTASVLILSELAPFAAELFPDRDFDMPLALALTFVANRSLGESYDDRLIRLEVAVDIIVNVGSERFKDRERTLNVCVVEMKIR